MLSLTKIVLLDGLLYMSTCCTIVNLQLLLDLVTKEIKYAIIIDHTNSRLVQLAKICMCILSNELSCVSSITEVFSK